MVLYRTASRNDSNPLFVATGRCGFCVSIREMISLAPWLLALSLAFYLAIVFAIWKVFQIGRDVSEIKRMLRDDIATRMREPG